MDGGGIFGAKRSITAANCGLSAAYHTLALNSFRKECPSCEVFILVCNVDVERVCLSKLDKFSSGFISMIESCLEDSIKLELRTRCDVSFVMLTCAKISLAVNALYFKYPYWRGACLLPRGSYTAS